MSDMQKVRVSLTDADGKVHEVVGYRYVEEWETVFQNDKPDGDDWSIYLMNNDGAVIVTPIQELPTGLGAVVEVDSTHWVRYTEEEWINTEGYYGSTHWLNAQKFTVLSEGVK